MKSLKVKIQSNLNRQLILETLSNEHRSLYNNLLEQTKTCRDFKHLNELYKNLNKLTIQSKSAQNTHKSLINSIKSFYA